MNRNLVLFLMIFLTGCMSGQNNALLSEDDKKSIRSVLETYANGWNVENPQETIMSLFLDDAVILPHHGDPQVEGKENIRNHFWPAGLTGFRVNSYDFEIMEITGNQNLAYPGFLTKKFFSQQGEGNVAAETYLSTLSKPF